MKWNFDSVEEPEWFKQKCSKHRVNINTKYITFKEMVFWIALSHLVDFILKGAF